MPDVVSTSEGGEAPERGRGRSYRPRVSQKPSPSRGWGWVRSCAYGWPTDISDDDALRELLALNRSRA